MKAPALTSRTCSFTDSMRSSMAAARLRVREAHAGPRLLLDEQFERRAHFLVEIALDAVSIQEVPPETQKASHHSDLNASLAAIRIARDTGT